MEDGKVTLFKVKLIDILVGIIAVFVILAYFNGWG